MLQLVRLHRPRPKLYQCCGLGDPLLAVNRHFRAFIEPLEFDYTYEEEPGEHKWEYWDRKIQRVLEWLPLRKPKAGVV